MQLQPWPHYPLHYQLELTPGALLNAHQPIYANTNMLTGVLADLKTRPSLVSYQQVLDLRQKIAAAGQGKSFILQGGDCAETFLEVTSEKVAAKLDTLNAMARVISADSNRAIITIGRMAGQYAKPRTQPTETKNGQTLINYLGDAINGHLFSSSSRKPDPARLRLAYDYARRTLDLMQDAGAQIYTSHEALLLDWESALCRQIPHHDLNNALSPNYHLQNGKNLNNSGETGSQASNFNSSLAYISSAHFLWIGERTRNLNGPHVELLSQVENPIGVKLGPSTTPDYLIALAEKLNPRNEFGRLTFISRLGAGICSKKLPTLLAASKSANLAVTWICDPMHGNTHVTTQGEKNRYFPQILQELEEFFAAHQAAGTIPAGIHLEFSADDATEVLDQLPHSTNINSASKYKSLVDPRLNRHQALKLAKFIHDLLEENHFH